AIADHEAEAVPQGGQWNPPVRMWHDRIKDEHPTSEPEYWPSSLKAKYMEAEILELRRLLAAAPPSPQPPAAPAFNGWYCAHCQRGVDASEVTYNEQHTVCGRVITDDLPPQPAPERVALTPLN